MFILFLDMSIALEQIHIFKTSFVEQLPLMGKMIERGKLRTGNGSPQVQLKD